jgi:hypothetical protein
MLQYHREEFEKVASRIYFVIFKNLIILMCYLNAPNFTNANGKVVWKERKAVALHNLRFITDRRNDRKGQWAVKTIMGFVETSLRADAVTFILLGLSFYSF